MYLLLVAKGTKAFRLYAAYENSIDAVEEGMMLEQSAHIKYRIVYCQNVD